MIVKAGRISIALLLVVGLVGCATYTSKVDNSAGRPTKYMDMEDVTDTEHVGIEAQDIVAMCDKMMRSMMANPILANSQRPPHVIIDSEGFTNESADVINLNIITDRIRNGLVRASKGRMRFVSQHAAMLVEKQKKLKAKGITGQGTTAYSKTTLGADYQLWGRITALQNVSNKTGLVDRMTYISFEMTDLQTGEIVWADDFGFRKGAADDVIYR